MRTPPVVPPPREDVDLSPRPDSESLTRIRTTAALGAAVRAKRRASGQDQIATAGLAGVGPRFLSELERGKPTLRLGLVLQVLDRLGLEVWIAPRRSRVRAR